jgi:hypothetical protein
LEDITLKTSKIDKILTGAIGKRLCVNCTMMHEDSYFNLVPLCRNGSIVLAAHDPDFGIDGYLVFSVEEIAHIEPKSGLYNEIMRKEGILPDIAIPQIDMESYCSLFGSFLAYGNPVSMYTKNGYYIGNVIKVGKNSVGFTHFDADGKRQETVKIPYDEIYIVSFGDRYTEMFSKYAEAFDGI